MIRSCRLYINDKYDIEETKSKFHIVTSRYEPIIFTNDPIKEINTLKPTSIVIDPYGFKGEDLALYVNSLLNEEYIIDYKKPVEHERDIDNKIVETWIYPSLYFKKEIPK